jgi:uncharacterized membrane protein YqiK
MKFIEVLVLVIVIITVSLCAAWVVTNSEKDIQCSSIYSPGQHVKVLSSGDSAVMLGINGCKGEEVTIHVGIIETGFKVTLNQDLIVSE